MNANRKRAYRYLLYQFLIDIRTVPVPESSASFTDKQCRNHVDYAGAVAYLLHNFALSAASDFEDFDEEGFWNTVEEFSVRCPSLSILHFKKSFDLALTGVI